MRSDVDIWQLFHDRSEVINARYPSAQWDDDSVYDWNNWGHGYYNITSNGDITDNSNTSAFSDMSKRLPTLYTDNTFSD